MLAGKHAQEPSAVNLAEMMLCVATRSFSLPSAVHAHLLVSTLIVMKAACENCPQENLLPLCPREAAVAMVSADSSFTTCS